MEFGSTNPEYGANQLILAARLEQEIESAANIYEFYNSLLEQYIDHPFIGGDMQTAASMVEPQDRDLGANTEVPAARAFYMGIIIGARVAELRGGHQLLDTLIEAPLPTSVEKTGDQLRDLHIQASLLVNKGIEVYTSSSAYHPLVERWEDMLVPDVTVQPYLKAGFGILLHLANGAERVRGYRELEEGLDSCDWDAEFAKLNTSE